jgi:hypothetical protein
VTQWQCNRVGGACFDKCLKKHNFMLRSRQTVCSTSKYYFEISMLRHAVFCNKFLPKINRRTVGHSHWITTVSSSIKEIPHILWNPHCLLPCSQKPATCSSSDPYRPSSFHCLLRFILILSHHLSLGHPASLFPSGIPTIKPCQFRYSTWQLPVRSQPFIVPLW